MAVRDIIFERLLGPKDTIFLGFEAERRKVYCGKDFGNVEIRPDGHIILSKEQGLRLTAYETMRNLKPTNMVLQEDGTFLVSVRK